MISLSGRAILIDRSFVCSQILIVVGSLTLILGLECSVTSKVFSQQIGVASPYTTTSNSWYEHHGVGFGFQLPAGRGPGSRIVGWNGLQTMPFLSFRQGGNQSAIPPFGGYDPNTAARFGFGNFGNNGGGFSLGLTMSKGSNRTMSSTVPSLVVQNGQGGGIWSGQISPFVTGVVPVTGFSPMIPQPLDNAVTRAVQSGQLDLSNLGQAHSASTKNSAATPIGFGNADSTATSAVSSVAAIKARKAQERAAKHEQMLQLISEAEHLSALGKYGPAATRVKRAAKLALTESERNLVDERIRQLPDLDRLP